MKPPFTIRLRFKLLAYYYDLLIKPLSGIKELKDGGAAMTAYARMQFGEMSDYERNKITKILIKYYALDTFAIVVIYESWREIIC